MQPREHRFGDPGRVSDRGSAECTHQEVLHAATYRGGVSIPGQIDQAGQITPVRIPTYEHPYLAAFFEVSDLLDDGGQLGQRGLEQLVARIGLQHVHDRLATMAVLAITRKPDDRGGLLAEHGNAGNAF